MDSIKVCDKCGLEIPEDAPEGRCPRCLMAAGMETLGADTLLEAELERSEPIELEVFEEIQGKYTMLGEHARGGMGRVLLVHDESLGRQVALKELLPGRGSSSNSPTPAEAQQAKELASRFLREARITGQLEHPSITPVHELGRREDGSLYYTMKLVKGKTLKDAIKECETLEERLKLLPHFVDLCNAIAYAHSRNVIHRDIKPANVMIGEYGETVILDWGLAKVKDTDEVGEAGQDTDPTAETVMGVQQDTPTSGHKTSAGQLLGTPVYMSPEQAKGLPADERSDIYSLGAVLYEILTSRPPFDGKTVDEIIAKVIYEQSVVSSATNEKIPAELSRITTRAMDKSPEARIGSCEELAELISGFSGNRVFINPMRPYLTDLLPELKLETQSSRRDIILESKARLWSNPKVAMRVGFVDCLSGSLYFLMLVVVVGVFQVYGAIVRLPTSPANAELVDQLTVRTAALAAASVLVLIGGVIWVSGFTSTVHRRFLADIVRDVLAELNAKGQFARTRFSRIVPMVVTLCIGMLGGILGGVFWRGSVILELSLLGQFLAFYIGAGIVGMPLGMWIAYVVISKSAKSIG